jgi:chloramphenicol O-acetyltransferase
MNRHAGWLTGSRTRAACHGFDPRFAFGKVFGDPSLRQMPLAVQGHHALMDGVHVGKFYTQIQEYLLEPHLWLT